MASMQQALTASVASGDESDALVADAGTGAANGTYTYTGTHNSKRYYNKSGTATNAHCIIWNSGDSRWEIWCDTGLGQATAYGGAEDTTYPWQVVTWTELGGDAPSPTVTEV